MTYQFTLGRSLHAIAYIAVVCLGFSLVARWDQLSDPGKCLGSTLVWTSPMLIGAGIGALFKRAGVGAVLGGLLAVALFMAFAGLEELLEL